MNILMYPFFFFKLKHIAYDDACLFVLQFYFVNPKKRKNMYCTTYRTYRGKILVAENSFSSPRENYLLLKTRLKKKLNMWCLLYSAYHIEGNFHWY